MIPDQQMMHASDWTGEDLTNWIATEKFDGFFARWTGQHLLTRYGVKLAPPAWFLKSLPPCPLDCELWAGYGGRLALNNAHRWRDPERWRKLRLVIFDAPTVAGNYRDRHATLRALSITGPHRLATVSTCKSRADVGAKLAAVIRRGGEGLVVRHPAALYTPGRVKTMFKVKP